MAEAEAHEVLTGEGYAVIYGGVGGKDGYVENDGHLLPSEESG